MATKTRTAPVMDRRAVSHQLRESIADDGRTAYALGKAAGVDAGMIQRFVNRERGLTLETVDRLALALGMRLVETGRGRGRPAKPARAVREQATSAEAAGPEEAGSITGHRADEDLGQQAETSIGYLAEDNPGQQAGNFLGYRAEDEPGQMVVEDQGQQADEGLGQQADEDQAIPGAWWL